MKNFTLLVSVVAVYFLGAFCVDAQVVTKTVDDGTDGTLRIEIADAGTGGTVTFDPSIQGQTINVTMGAIPINAFAAITIDGNNGGTSTTISSGSNSRIFDVDATIAAVINFDSVIFRDGSAESGGAILASGATTVVNIADCEFRSNIATGAAATNGGGAIFNDGATVAITGTLFRDNRATGTSGSGGAILNSNGGTLAIDNSIFRVNVSQRAGGAIEDNANAASVITISNSTFAKNEAGTNPGNGGALHVSGSSSYTFDGGAVRENIAGKEGGGLWNNLGTLTINGTIIEDNVAQGDFVAGTPPQIVGGGGIFAEDGTGVVVINEGTIIRRNQATGVQGSGGGILMATGTTLTINGTVANPVMIMDNQASRAGGGIEDWSLDTNSNTITNVDFSGNSAGLDGTNFTANGGPGNGGAIHVTGPGSNTITGGTATANLAANEGGAFWNGTGTMTVDGTSIANNTASGAGAANGGGGFFNLGGTLDISSAIIDGNAASGAAGSGGGILNTRGGTINVTSSSITNNTAVRAGGGIEDNSTIDVNGSVPVGSISLDGVTLDSNNTSASPGNGGGMHLTGAATSTITGGTVNNNTASNEGGGLWNGSGTMTVSGVQIDSNIAAGNDTSSPGAAGGGGIYNEGGTVVLTNNTVVSNNQATGAQSTGGGVLNAAGTFTATDSEISSNESNRAGGGIETNGTSSVTLTNVTLDSNITGVVTGMGAPGNGGALHVSGAGSVDITGGTVNTNDAANEGGGLWNGTGTMTVSGTTISANTARGSDAEVAGASGGGGIYNEGGTVNLTNNTVVSNNQATGAQSTGGGVLNAAGVFTATDSEISGNESNRAGGGIETNGDSSVELTNTNLDGNLTGATTGPGAPGNGGGLHVSGAAPVTITGGTVNNNIARKEGGGLWNNGGLLTINGTTLSGNDAQGDFVAGMPPEIVGGGAIFSEDSMTGSVVINEGTIIDGNVATGVQGSGGGILMATGTTLTINGTTANPVVISNNSASRAGGGIEDWSLGATTSTITNVNFTGNTAGLNSGDFIANGGPGNGGAIHITGPGLMDIIGGTADSNSAALEGGAFWNNVGTMTISDVDITNNTSTGAGADDGGAALFNNGGTLNVSDSFIDGNLATGASGSGGALLSTTGAVTITNTTITNNAANRAGGAIELIDGTLDISSSEISNNDVDGTAGTAAPGNGGALHISGSSVVNIDSSIINSNSAAAEGGALWNQLNSVMVVSNSTLDGNSANGTAVDNGGGAIFNNGGDTEVYDTTISNNTSVSNGGGISNQVGSLIVETSTISSNTASLDGAGVYHAGTNALFDIVTVARNIATGNGGGLASVAGTFSITNTLVAENQAASDFNVSGITSNDYNLIEIDDTNSFTAMPNDIVGTVASPEFASLGPLQDNGGNTFTHAILDGTRAQDQGNPNNNLTDQRGEAVFGPARDIGSFEAQQTLSNDDIAAALAAVRLYPNPSSDGRFTIQLPAQVTSTATYRITDMTGKVVGGSSLRTGVNNLQMNNLSAGIYIVQVTAADQSQSLKLIIE
ncbi:hypothetical protein AAU57_09415 [Nonlabens sp. YIK11]|uniref:T9SS type A sorting domain-containing protein n=1 Tax=Nonlabens sp. YIK11 TaxID=1453349 RepID=UPI0006DC35BE|nr:T9SS type A sorting domain-containing protein [Nonlabens sp. YIK11]KQC33508.1 hypothetical protein AAU57_09415 [Nonlabens sp. YIK11]